MEIAIVVVIVFVVYLATITQAEKQEFNKGLDKVLAKEKDRWYTAIEKAEAAKDKDEYKNFKCPSCGEKFKETPNEILGNNKERMHMTCLDCDDVSVDSPYWKEFDFD